MKEAADSDYMPVGGFCIYKEKCNSQDKKMIVKQAW